MSDLSDYQCLYLLVHMSHSSVLSIYYISTSTFSVCLSVCLFVCVCVMWYAICLVSKCCELDPESKGINLILKIVEVKTILERKKLDGNPVTIGEVRQHTTHIRDIQTYRL